MAQQSRYVTQPYTTHLHSGNHSLGHVAGLTYSRPSTSSTPPSASFSGPPPPICHYIGGIPYALPPTGQYRFRKPRPLAACHRYGTLSHPGNFTGRVGVCPQPAFKAGKMRLLRETWDEDCLQANIWIPAGEPPGSKGWPVLLFFHGGFLQVGNANSLDPVAAMELMAKKGKGCMIVAPGYRLGVLGFLASGDCGLHGNWGFWDQRLALEWTWKWCTYFGGDPTEITLSGYSAGAHSTFHQLAHDLSLPPSKRMIRRAHLFSNGPGAQPKSLSSTTTRQQYSQLLRTLGISLHFTTAETLKRLRALPAADLVRAATSIPLHEFRGTSAEEGFISPHLFSNIDTGDFARRLLESNTEILIGECADEHHVYARWRPPASNTHQAVRNRLHADFEPAVVDAVLTHYCGPRGELPTIQGHRCTDWKSDAFGRIYAELNIHALSRGFVAKLHEHGGGRLVRRYRIEWRSSSPEMDAMSPRSWGVSHGSDLVGVWFPFLSQVEGGEGEVLRRWGGAWWGWVAGKRWSEFGGGEWPAGERRVRRLRRDGRVDVAEDGMYDDGVGVWDVSRKAQVDAERKLERKAKL